MSRLRTERVDITTLAVDAIVNAANPLLLGGGGVDGAIHRAAGPELLEACRRIPEVAPGVRCETGSARITPGFRLPARHVIHTVGPVWQGGGVHEERELAACYRSVLAVAAEHALQSLAFPAISCGVYGFPKERACQIAVATLRAHVEASGVRDIVLVAFDATMQVLWSAALARD